MNVNDRGFLGLKIIVSLIRSSTDHLVGEFIKEYTSGPTSPGDHTLLSARTLYFENRFFFFKCPTNFFSALSFSP